MGNSRLLGYEVQRLGIIKIFSVEIDGRHITKFTGANGQGKTTALKAIEMLLSTKAVPQEPIQHGESSAQIIGRFDTDRGEIIVKKVFNKANPRGILRVAVDGIWQKSPQTVLEDLLGLISFNPLNFCESPPELQKEMLLDSLGVREEVTALTNQYEELYSERTEIQKEIKRLQLTLDKIPTVEETYPLNIMDILSSREKALQHNIGNDRVKEDLVKTTQLLDDLKFDGASLKKELTQLDEEIERLTALREQKKKELDVLGKDYRVNIVKKEKLEKDVKKLTYKDISVFDRQLNQVEDHNTKANHWKEKQELKAEANLYREKVKGLNSSMKEVLSQRDIVIKNSTIPIEGLDFTDEGVRYNETLVSEISRAEKLLVGCAVMSALNPRLRLILMDDAEKLDSHSLGIIEDWASKNDMFILMAMVDESGETGVVFEDGEVIANEYKEKDSSE